MTLAAGALILSEAVLRREKQKDEEELEHEAALLSASGTVFYTCHCTGKNQFDWLKERLGDRLHYLAGGMSIEL